MGDKITLSVIKADVGGYVGHSAMHPDLIEEGNLQLEKAKAKNIITDYHVTACGDDLELIMTHYKGDLNTEIHKVAWDIFESCTDLAKKLKLYGAGQDLISDAFSGNVKGMGPGIAEMTFEERKSEPIIILLADKTSAGAWNLPLYKIFCDPFNTIGLVISPTMHDGFLYEVHDVMTSSKIIFDCPNEIYDLLVYIGAPGRYMVKSVLTKKNEIACVSSTEKLSLMAGKYVGKDDPVCIIRSQGDFPAIGEILEPFTQPTLVEGWMRGSHNGPLMPVSVPQATPSRFDGPPRVIALGFQINNGKLVGPRDLFDDPGFDNARKIANELADHMRRHGPFEPHRLPMDEMEYTTLPNVMERLKDRWKEL